jgi:hypothetical protein
MATMQINDVISDGQKHNNILAERAMIWGKFYVCREHDAVSQIMLG